MSSIATFGNDDSGKIMGKGIVRLVSGRGKGEDILFFGWNQTQFFKCDSNVLPRI